MSNQSCIDPSARDPCLQASQRQIALRGEANLTSPSKRICPTPTWNGYWLARCFARGSIRQPTPASAPRTVPQPVSSRSQIDLRQLFGTGTQPTSTPKASPRGEGDIYRPFGTGTLNRTTSGAGARAEASPNQPQTGLLPMLRLDFGTASPAGGLSVASPRGEAVIYRLFVHKKPLFHGR